ncbi:protein SRG1-like isoform X1 [Lotus japonicus]|uniref:Fe2OG dioxygenase domain-containing protein n=1 Tax=Lotus japonicus TaxID=34305 RepID=I3SSJ3_LOTJA|nr:protein SRG1-like isoform X1 [Lotus japonicus]XP_057448035.1 protein SRG1-like isoform X1 [Lotus japonicus]AFK43235.1 unknown [Lotus japonicus]
MSEPGTSLLVPSVQELAKQHMIKVPEQYLHPNQEPINVAPSTTTSLQVPIIDLNKLLSEDAIELDKLNSACKEWGFFQLINHGVKPSLVENVKIGVQEFFGLPMEQKKKFWQTPEDIEGFGQLFVVSEDQKLDWADLFFINTLPSYARNPRLFPNIPQPLRENLESYCLELERVFNTMINCMEKALEMEPNEVLKLFDVVSQTMRWNYYPPCPQPENVIGINPHTDAGVLTLLLQVNETEGLQIRKDGKWVPVTPLSNAFVINVGDIMEILTNGIYRSIEHRATINSEKERISIASFHRPLMNKVIGPTPSLVTPERPALFKTIAVEDFYRVFFSRQLKGKTLLNAMRIENETGKC